MSTAHPLASLAVLDQFRMQPVSPSYPTNMRTFFSPVDDVHGALKYLLGAATPSLLIAVYGFDDYELADIIMSKLKDPTILVQLTLDASQAGGVHERKLLARENYPASSIAIGNSEHGRIMHDKLAIVDGIFVVTGSTNWSDAGERLQSNQMTVISDAYVAAETTARIGATHANMLQKQQA